MNRLVILSLCSILLCQLAGLANAANRGEQCKLYGAYEDETGNWQTCESEDIGDYEDPVYEEPQYEYSDENTSDEEETGTEDAQTDGYDEPADISSDDDSEGDDSEDS